MTARDSVLAYLRSQTIGPVGGASEIVSDPPYVRYLMGTLYPRNVDPVEVREEEEEDGPIASTLEEGALEDPVQFANEWMPSSVGLTFYFEGPAAIECEVWGARYETKKKGRSRQWHRLELATQVAPESVTLTSDGKHGSRSRRQVLGGRGQLDALWRLVGKGRLVTVTLQNPQSQNSEEKLDPQLCLHQVGFRCRPKGGEIREYPSVSVLSPDPEEQELRLLYRGSRIYAVGHGCATVSQHGDSAEKVTHVGTEFMPTYELAALTYDVGEIGDCLLLRWLADDSVPVERLRSELARFMSAYAAWIGEVEKAGSPRGLKAARDRLLGRLRHSAAGMRRGVELLCADSEVRNAFRLANRAMLMQMRHSSREFGGTRRLRGQASTVDPNYQSLNYRWRPFQLAFQLLTLPSVASEQDPDRGVVDLIWFPTGGGKTEAYLSIAAFQVFLRRLRSKNDGAGTTVLTRYTLRLLTAQQFQRAATLVCACEVLRRAEPTRFGTSPITLGLWVGKDVVPNTFQDAAVKLLELLEEVDPQNRFQLEQCPWCGTEIVPQTHTEERAAYGVDATATSFRFFCPSNDCDFHSRIPVAVIDDDLYESPPTILIGTVDKFARLAWEERAGAFFGSGGHQPPSLIIQDELHLLTGPLGTTMGVYESAVDGLIRLRGGNAKVIASTATIRRADDQALGLFNRDIRVFPASGLKATDSFFAREDRTVPGRLYVGAMSQSHTMAKCMVDVCSALLQAPVELELRGDDRDAYWTLVAYHNSLRELGRTVTQANDDIRARLPTIASDQARVRMLGDNDIVELTGNLGGDRLPALLGRLGRAWDERDAISFLATTSMLSVGVDVPRLGLMVVNSQPKTTAEYIQATSRVGRTARAPGLIITLFSATKPRDRSHYEGFLGYHGALYRHVEPSSATPFSMPSRSRALHAALVILVRHGAGLAGNGDAGRVLTVERRVRDLIKALEARVLNADRREAGDARRQLDRWFEQWCDRATEAIGLGKTLYYSSGTKQQPSLLKTFGSPGQGWDTLHSMRSVDRECRVTVYGER